MNRRGRAAQTRHSVSNVMARGAFCELLEKWRKRRKNHIFLSLARRFSASKCEKWKKSRTKRSFWKLVAKFGRSLWEVLLAFRGVAESIEKLRAE